MLLNSFSQDTKEFYITHDLINCGLCTYQGAELHHILGRRHKENSSIYNSFLLCRRCHNKKDIHSIETRKKMLEMTLDLLIRYDYKLTKQDKKFILNNKKYYEHSRLSFL